MVCLCNSRNEPILWLAAEPPRLPLRRELSSLSVFKGLTEGEITRGRCLLRGADEHRVKKRSFAFSVGYIYCFRTYLVYLSLRLPAQILYAGIHLPPQREARALPRRAQIFPLRSVKFGFDFTVCLYSLHSPAIIIGYYISTLHFHIFLLFSISFL